MEISKNRFNTGTDYGRNIIEQSIMQFGCCRPILSDANGIILCGNDVYQIAKSLGKKIIVIETCADVLVVAKRVDVDANSTVGKYISLLDNLSAEKNLNWDANLLLSTMQEYLAFDPRRFGGHGCLEKELNIEDLFKEDINIIKKKGEKTANFELSDSEPTLFD